jgi:hypothetical protein
MDDYELQKAKKWGEVVVTYMQGLSQHSDTGIDENNRNLQNIYCHVFE